MDTMTSHLLKLIDISLILKYALYCQDIVQNIRRKRKSGYVHFCYTLQSSMNKDMQCDYVTC